MRPRRPEKKPREAGLAPRPLEALPPPGARRVLNPILPWPAALGLARRSRGRARAWPFHGRQLARGTWGGFPRPGARGPRGTPKQTNGTRATCAVLGHVAPLLGICSSPLNDLSQPRLADSSPSSRSARAPVPGLPRTPRPRPPAAAPTAPRLPVTGRGGHVWVLRPARHHGPRGRRGPLLSPGLTQLRVSLRGPLGPAGSCRPGPCPAGHAQGGTGLTPRAWKVGPLERSGGHRC